MRIVPCLPITAAMILLACHRAPAASIDRRAEVIDCDPAGAAFARNCAVELAPGGLVTVRNPDGGFHRLRVAGGGRGVVAADGAATAQVRVIGANTIEVAIGGDRYRLPAIVGATR